MNRNYFVSINARFTHTNLAFYYLRQIAISNHCELFLLEFTINQNLSHILREISVNKPDNLFFSVYIWNSELIKKILPEIKKILPNSQIILGGPEVSYNSNEWIDNFTSIDHIIIGNGEKGFETILRDHNQLKIINEGPISLKDIPFPYKDVDLALLKTRYLYYESSRGCPFRCSYCLSSRNDQKLEMLPLDRVKTELDFMISFKPRIIKFVDRTFNSKHEHSRGIWKFLIENNPSTTFHFEIQVELLNDKDFDILAKAPKNLFQFEIGIQSLNQKTLEAVNRKSNWAIAKGNIIRLIELKNIHIHVDLIAGLPFDDISTFSEAFNEVHSTGSDNFQLGFLKVLPGTEMAENISDYHIRATSSAPYEILSNKWLSFEELAYFKEVEIWLNRFYNTGRFKISIIQLIKLHKSPIDFYGKFIQYIAKNDLPYDSEKWEKNAFLMLSYWKTISDNVDFIMDCLRWDWCSHASGHFYPSFLASDALKNLKKNNNSELKDNVRKGKYSLHQLRKAILFKAYSPEFLELVQQQSDMILFIKDPDKLIQI